MKKIVNYDNRTFICDVTYCGDGLGQVTVYERKHPNWLIFKDSYCGTKKFFDVDYPTIEAAVYRALHDILDASGDSSVLNSKWQQFKKTLNEPLEI